MLNDKIYLRAKRRAKMASQSAHFYLTKPATTDNYDIAVFNGNTDIIDTQMYNNQQAAAKVMVGATSGAAGESGRVPTPTAGEETKVLTGGGTFETVTSLIDPTSLSAQQIADLKTALGI